MLINGELIISVSIDEGLSSVGMLLNWIKKYKENAYVKLLLTYTLAYDVCECEKNLFIENFINKEINLKKKTIHYSFLFFWLISFLLILLKIQNKFLFGEYLLHELLILI